MKAGVKWFVEISRARGRDFRIEEGASLREARAMVKREEARPDFDAATDSVTIYRGKSWHTAKLFKSRPPAGR